MVKFFAIISSLSHVTRFRTKSVLVGGGHQKEDDTMAQITKPVTGVFMLDERKVKDFFGKKRPTSEDALRRIRREKPVEEMIGKKK